MTAATPAAPAVFVSLGERCQTAAFLTRHGARTVAYPFDSVGTYDAGELARFLAADGHRSILRDASLLRTHVWSPQQVEVSDARWPSIVFPHSFRTVADVAHDGGRAVVADTLARRVERLRTLLGASGGAPPLLLLRVRTSDADAGALLRALDSFAPGHAARLVCSRADDGPVPPLEEQEAGGERRVFWVRLPVLPPTHAQLVSDEHDAAWRAALAPVLAAVGAAPLVSVPPHRRGRGRGPRASP